MSSLPPIDLPDVEVQKKLIFEQKIKNLTKAIQRNERLLKNLHNDLAICLENIKLNEKAELLKANFHLLRKGQQSVLVVNYFSDPLSSISIPIDPKLSPEDNINNFFKLVKRAKRGILHIEPRIQQAALALEKLHQELSELNDAGFTAIPKDEAPIRPKKKLGKRLPYRVFIAEDGNLFWAGRSAKDNDELLKFYTKGNEWWFHAKESSGSHVILKNSNDAPSLELLLDAACLAAHFSKKKDAAMEVCYTRVKYVKKVKGMPAGMVSITHTKTLLIKNEQARLERLLKEEIKSAP